MKRMTHWRNTLKRGALTTINAVKGHQASGLQVAGLAVFAAGGFVLALWLGLFLLGAFLCLVGWAVDE